MRRGIIAIAAALLSVTAAPASAQTTAAEVDPVRLAIARQVVAFVLPPDQRQQIMASFLRSMLQNMIAGIVDGTPGLKNELATSQKVKAAFDRFVARQQSLSEADISGALPGLIEAYAKAYARLFTQDELAQIRTFVSTPTGAKFMQRGPALIADPDVAAWQRRVTEQGTSRQRAEMTTFARELRAARGGSDGQ